MAKASEAIDWESIHEKYQEIAEIFQACLRERSVHQTDKDYPHDPEEVTKAHISSKLKNIPSKYRKAVEWTKICGSICYHQQTRERNI